MFCNQEGLQGMGSKFHRDLIYPLCGSLGLLASLALLLPAWLPVAVSQMACCEQSWNTAGCAAEPSPYAADLTSTTPDLDELCHDQPLADRNPALDPAKQSKAFEFLASRRVQPVALHSLTRSAPKRSPPQPAPGI